MQQGQTGSHLYNLLYKKWQMAQMSRPSGPQTHQTCCCWCPAGTWAEYTLLFILRPRLINAFFNVLIWGRVTQSTGLTSLWNINISLGLSGLLKACFLISLSSQFWVWQLFTQRNIESFFALFFSPDHWSSYKWWPFPSFDFYIFCLVFDKHHTCYNYWLPSDFGDLHMRYIIESVTHY